MQTIFNLHIKHAVLIPNRYIIIMRLFQSNHDKRYIFVPTVSFFQNSVILHCKALQNIALNVAYLFLLIYWNYI